MVTKIEDTGGLGVGETANSDKQRDISGLIPWQPGQSGNPAGRPVNPESITNLLRKLGNQKRSGKAITRLEELALRIWDNSLEGQFNYSQELYNRLEGKVSDSVDITDKTESLLLALVRNRRGNATDTGEESPVPEGKEDEVP